MYSSGRAAIVFPLFVSLFYVSIAHFTLIGSREQALFPGSNERFWPIGMGSGPETGSFRSVRDCMLYKSTKPRPALKGSNIELPFEIGNGASHVGTCSAFLYDAVSSKLVAALGEQENCVSKGQKISIAIPSSASCSKCVIKVKVTATHRAPEPAELYDSCYDISLDGESSSREPSAPESEPTNIAQVPRGTSSIEPVEPTEQPTRVAKKRVDAEDPELAPEPSASTPKPRETDSAEAGNTPAAEKRALDDSTDATDALLRLNSIGGPSGAVLPDKQAPPPRRQRKRLNSNKKQPTKNEKWQPDSSCSFENHGNMMCSDDKKAFAVCVYNRWIIQVVPSGAICKSAGYSIQFAHDESS